MTAKIPSIQTVLREATAQLKASSSSASFDAELLLLHVLNKPRAFLYAHNDDILASSQIKAFQALLSKREKGVPIAYLLGEREFWSLLLYVTPDTLIPRPETEQLVELVLSLMGERTECAVLELGTGTGAISIALANEKPHWTFLALDKSAAALDVAQKNISRHQLQNVTLLQSNWFDKLGEQRFDLILSNPPYLAKNDPHQHEGDLRFEPQSALLSGMDGLDDLNHIICHAPAYLTDGGLLLLEHGYDQGPAVTQKLAFEGYKNIQCWQDVNRHDRISGGWYKKA